MFKLSQNNSDKEVKVFHCDVKNTDIATWQELVDGYNEVKIATFSTSLSFIEKFVNEDFENVEILLGNEKVISGLKDVLQFQISHAIFFNQNLIKHKKLVSLIEQDKCHLFVCQSKTSHKKIILLKNETENKYRVITGSANLSQSAFEGLQSEIIQVFDGIDNYNFFLEDYEETKSYAFANVMLKEEGKPFERLEIQDIEKFVPAINNENGFELDVVDSDNDALKDQIIFEDVVKEDMMDVSDIIKNSDIKKKDIKTSEKNKLFISSHIQQKLKSNLKKLARNVEKKRSIFPSLWYSDIEHELFYMNELMDLSFDLNNVKNDLDIMQKVFASYNADIFKMGDVEDTKRKFYQVFIYMMVAPFISVTRKIVVDNPTLGVEVYKYPMFMSVSGKSNAGKTKMLEFLLRLLFPKSPTIYANGNYKPGQVIDLKYATKGHPLIIDDMVNTSFTHYKKNIKTDNEIEKNVSPLIFTTNQDLGDEKEYNKRMCRLYVNTQTDKVTMFESKNITNKFNDDISGDINKMFLTKMLAEYRPFLVNLEKENDLFALANRIFKEILQECGIEPLSWMKDFTTQDLLINESVKEEKQILINKYIKARDSVEVNKRLNYLQFLLTEKEVKRWEKIYDFLLLDITPTAAGDHNYFFKLDLKKSKEYFNIDFKNEGFFSKQLKKIGF